MQALGRLRTAGDSGDVVAALRIALAPGLDPYVWALSEPARSLGLACGADGDFYARGVDATSALMAVQRDQRVLSAAIVGEYRPQPAAGPDPDLAAEFRPEPGRPEYALPGYVPKDRRSTSLTWEEKALAGAPALGSLETGASGVPSAGPLLLAVLGVGYLLLGRK